MNVKKYTPKDKFKDKEREGKGALTIYIYEDCLISCSFISVFSLLTVRLYRLGPIWFYCNFFACSSFICCLSCSFFSVVGYFLSLSPFVIVSSSSQTISRVTFAPCKTKRGRQNRKHRNRNLKILLIVCIVRLAFVLWFRYICLLSVATANMMPA